MKETFPASSFVLGYVYCAGSASGSDSVENSCWFICEYYEVAKVEVGIISFPVSMSDCATNS